MTQSWTSKGRDSLTSHIVTGLFQKDVSFHIGAARAGLVVAYHTDWLDVVDLRPVMALAANIHVCLAV